MWLFSEIKCVGDIPRHYGRVLPEKTALIDAVGAMSFAELDARSNRCANALIKLGIEPGDRVAFLGKNSNIYFDALFGAAKVGAMLVPINWRLATAEMASIMEDASPAVILADREYHDTAELIGKSSGTQCQKLLFDSLRPDSSEFEGLLESSDA